MTTHGGKRIGSVRPRGSTVSAELREAAQGHTQEALAALVEVMQDQAHPQRIKAAQIILERGHGKPHEIPATNEIINQFIDGEITAITACLMIEAQSLKVPDLMKRYFQNEMARASHMPHSQFLESFGDAPPLLPRS